MLKNKIAENLKKAIAKGTFKPGERLIEARICDRYKVGRSVVREALRSLEHDGFVKIIPNSGAIVTELSQKDIEQIYDLMGTLEGLAMRVATPILNPKEIAKIEKIIKKMEATSNPFKFFEYNFEFHNYLDSLSGNDRLIKFMKNLRAQAHRISLRSFYNPGQIRASLIEHRKILEAIKEMDGEKVENLIRDHYLQSKNRLIKFLNRSL
ncbi:MAG: GntR family transcriptional regulator [Candidatus Anstonellales archaeon]